MQSALGHCGINHGVGIDWLRLGGASVVACDIETEKPEYHIR
jgi:hypothetical protein